MKLIRPLLMYILVATIAMPVSAVIFFDIFWLRPRAEHITNLVENGSVEERKPAQLTRKMVMASEPKGLNWQVARILIIQSESPFKPSSMLQWHAVGAATSLLLKLHFSDEELLATYCARVYVGNNSYGLSAASQKLFSKNLSELSASEAATVAAWPAAPNMFAKNQAALDRHRDRILERVGLEARIGSE